MTNEEREAVSQLADVLTAMIMADMSGLAYDKHQLLDKLADAKELLK